MIIKVTCPQCGMPMFLNNQFSEKNYGLICQNCRLDFPDEAAVSLRRSLRSFESAEKNTECIKGEGKATKVFQTMANLPNED